MKTAYFDCFSGISGNMIIGAFLDAGMPFDVLQENLSLLNLPDSYELINKKVSKLGIGATYFDVNLIKHTHHEHHNHHQDTHHHRNLSQITDIIENSKLDKAVKELALKIFHRLGEAEAKVHNCSITDIHFHEVGAVDAIIDIVGAALGISYFGIEKIFASPLHVGKGTVKCAHGLMPIPAPATAELLKGASIYATDITGELVTPTGAAVITALTDSFGNMPDLQIENVSYGAGSWDLGIPNVLRLFLGKTQADLSKKDKATIIETTIDDMNPEYYNHVMDKLFTAGAVDVYLNPIYMKKNRPGVLLTITSTLADQQPLLDILFKETTTLGIRMYETLRLKLEKSFKEINTPYGQIKIKIGSNGTKILNIAPEFEDCKRLAQKTGIPLKKIYQEALLAGYNEIHDISDKDKLIQ